MHVFFSRFLLSRNYKIQIVARVGRKSAVVLPGTVEASYPHFFIGIDLDCQRALLETVKPGKSILIGLQSPREWKNRTRLDEYHFFYCLIPPEDDSRKKNMWSYKITVWCYRIYLLSLPRKSEMIGKSTLGISWSILVVTTTS